MPVKIKFSQEQKEDIISLYTIDNITTYDIAKKFNVSRSKICGLLKENNIKTKNFGDYHTSIPKEKHEEIFRLYFEENKTAAEIGKIFNVCGGTIQLIFKRSNINMRQQRVISDKEKAEMFDLYKSGKSIGFLSRKFKFSTGAISRLLTLSGIEIINKAK